MRLRFPCLLVLTLVFNTVAFDLDAHDAIGQTAASAMDQEAIRQLKRMLDGQDASEVAGWGHQVDDTYPGMERLHFQVHDDKANGGFCGSEKTAKCEDNICLLASIKHFYGKVLADEGRRTDYPAIDYTKVAKGLRWADADLLKMLINLLGDLHQPLHVGYAVDDNGRNTMVKFRGKTISLYEVWDSAISEAVRTTESNFWLGGWTHVRAVGSEYESDKQKWKEEGSDKSFERWLDESVKFACEKAYTHPITGKKLAGPGAEAGPVEIGEDAYQEWRQMWLQRILIAGERTAIVLNDILDAKGAARLAKGGKVQTKADEEKAKEMAEWEQERVKQRKEERKSRSAPPMFNASVFMTNLSIAIVTVPLTILVATHGLNPLTYQDLIKSLLETPTGGSAPKGPGKRFE